MNASPNEVALILAAIEDVRGEVKKVESNVSAMDRRINGRIRQLEAFRWQLVGMAAFGVIGLNVALRFI